MTQRNIEVEASNRIKSACLAHWKQKATDCKVDDRTYQTGFDFINSDGSHIYSGVEFESVMKEIDDGKPAFDPVSIYEIQFSNSTSVEEDFVANLGEDVVVSSGTSFSFTEGIKIGVKVGLGGPVAAVSGFKAELKIEGSFEANQTFTKYFTTTQKRNIEKPLTIQPGKSKIISIVTTRADTKVPFIMTVKLAGTVFAWAKWKGAEDRWAGWPKEADYKNPFAFEARTVMAADDNPDTGGQWDFHGTFENVQHTKLEVLIANGPDVQIDPNATGVETVLLKAIK
jgi:hypothetical protein